MKKGHITTLAWLSGTLLYMSPEGKILSFRASGVSFNKCLKLSFSSVLFYSKCPLQYNSVNHRENKKTKQKKKQKQKKIKQTKKKIKSFMQWNLFLCKSP